MRQRPEVIERHDECVIRSPPKQPYLPEPRSQAATQPNGSESDYHHVILVARCFMPGSGTLPPQPPREQAGGALLPKSKSPMMAALHSRRGCGCPDHNPTECLPRRENR